MELWSLNSSTTSPRRFQPEAVFDDHESLIWSERYSTAGDFELVTSKVQEAIDLFKLESYVGIRQSTVPMIVESHKIEKPKGKQARVTIKGRTFESVLERRASVKTLAYSGSPSARPAWNEPANKVSDAAYLAMRTVIGDITRSRPAVGALPAVSLPAISPMLEADRIPEINLILPTDYGSGTPASFEIKPGSLYPVVLELLGVNHHGIRSVRPGPGKTTVDIEIYNGADLRSTAVFDARFDQFDNATYLMSYQASMNVAYVYGSTGATVQPRSNVAPEKTGLERRVLLLDEMSDSILSSPEVRKSRGLVELYNHNPTAIFDGETSVQIGELYNKPIEQGGYGLGDIVKLQGDYDIERDVRVVEFIRTSDSSGYSAYPAFEVLDE